MTMQITGDFSSETVEARLERKNKTVTVHRRNDFLYRSSKGFTKILPELTDKFSKISGSKVNTQKLGVFLQKSNKQLKA